MISNTALTLLLSFVGVFFGLLLPELTSSISFLGQIFISLLKMIIIPFVAASIFLAIIKIDKDSLKKLGGITLFYYLLTSALACFVGLVIANLIGLGHIDIESEILSTSLQVESFSFASLVLSFFPQNIFDSLAKGKIIHIILITIIFALSTFSLTQSSRVKVVDIAEILNSCLSKILKGIIYYIAPIGIFSLVASLMAQIDPSMFAKFKSVFIVISLSILIHVLISLPLVSYIFGKFNAYQVYLKIKNVLLVALTTASSSATLPVALECAKDELEVKKENAEFILPLGSTINMDGSALYQGIVVLFLASLAGISLGLSQQILVLLIVMVSAVGTAGIPSGGLVMIGAVMESVGIPLEYIAVYLVIDRFWDYPVTMINVLGDMIGVKTIDKLIK